MMGIKRARKISYINSPVVRSALLILIFLLILAGPHAKQPSAHLDDREATGAVSDVASPEGVSINELFFNPCEMEEEQQDMPVPPTTAPKYKGLGGDVPPIRSILDS